MLNETGNVQEETPDELLLREIEWTFGLSCSKAKDASDPRDENLAFQVAVSMHVTDVERATKVEMLAESIAQRLRGLGYSKSIDRLEELLVESNVGCYLSDGRRIEP